jgi:hypothetical protein
LFQQASTHVHTTAAAATVAACESPVAVIFVGGACHHVIVCYDDAVVPLHEVLLAAVRCKNDTTRNIKQSGSDYNEWVQVGVATHYCCCKWNRLKLYTQA